jgi:raffinose/stachyose/melibiose transport system permease protein
METSKRKASVQFDSNHLILRKGERAEEGRKGRIPYFVSQAVLWILAVVYIYPVVLVMLSALKTKAELAVNPFGLPSRITFEHFTTAFQTMHFFKSVFNSLIITGISVFILVFIASAAAYAIIRRNNRFYNGLYLFFLAGLIVPFQMTMIPLYKLMVNLEFINSYHGIILVYLALTAPFSIFILSGFVRGVPRELEEAAKMDGCGLYRTFFSIVMPLMKPALATVAILNTFHIWNDFLMPMLFLPSTGMKTLTVQLFSFVGQYFNDWSPIFAGIFLIVYPLVIVYVFAQRFIIKGITAGAVKG